MKSIIKHLLFFILTMAAICIVVTFWPSSATVDSALDINHIPTQVPTSARQKLAWGLYTLDNQVVSAALSEGADPYTLKSVIKGLPAAAYGKELSPYTFAIEGYLHRTYREQNVAKICEALDRLTECIEALINARVVVDYGVLTLEGNPSLREFIHASIARLTVERVSEDWFDVEGAYALSVLQHIDELMGNIK